MIFFSKRFIKMDEANDGTGGAGGGGTVVMSGDEAAAAARAAAAAPATPAPTPAAPAPAATPAATEPAEAAKTVEWAKTGHQSLDISLTWLGNQGLGEENELVQLAAKTGNFDGLKAHFAQNPTPGAAEMLSILENSFKEFVGAENEKRAKEAAEQVAFLGGAERADAVVAWASENAEPHEKAAFNAMMDQGGFQARAALAYVSSLYDKANSQDPVNIIPQAQVHTGGGRGGPQASNTPITRAQLAEEGAKLYQTHGDAYVHTPAYRALLRRVA